LTRKNIRKQASETLCPASSIVLSSLVCTGLLKCPFLSDFLTKTCMHLPYPHRATFPAHLILPLRPRHLQPVTFTLPPSCYIPRPSHPPSQTQTPAARHIYLTPIVLHSPPISSSLSDPDTCSPSHSPRSWQNAEIILSSVNMASLRMRLIFIIFKTYRLRYMGSQHFTLK
jgi:hypothetical protein